MARTPPARLSTGNPTLDQALDGGLPTGSIILVEGEDGAGATEFALTMLRDVARRGGRARMASVLRSPSRVRRELEALFPGDDAIAKVAVDEAQWPQHGARPLLEDPPGSLVVLESASALTRERAGRDVVPLFREMADACEVSGILALLLSAPDTMPSDVEASLSEAADGCLSFRWLEGGNARRRILRVKKLRGLAPVLDGEQIPVFEVGLHRGRGYSISKVKSLL